jgi:hypothetical protein
VSSYRGLFLYCPVLLFAAVGAVEHWRTGRRLPVVACSLAFAASVALIASFNAWGGGSASGARYLVVAIPLLSLLAPTLAGRERFLYYALLAVSCLNMLALTAVEVMADDTERSPLYGLAYRELFSGAYPHNPDTLNLGRLLGLAPPFDVLLFVLLFGAGAALLLRGYGRGAASSRNSV